MSPRSNNQKEVNAKLMELNKKYIPENKIILNTSPPRAGKTINTILYHIENKIPAIVFIDNKEQADNIENNKKINSEKGGFNLYRWKKKEDLCYIRLNKSQIIEEKGKNYFEEVLFKEEKGISSCKNCEHYYYCEWSIQKRDLYLYDIILMNKKNISTPLVENFNKELDLDIFYTAHRQDKEIVKVPRTIIYDEKLEELHTIKFQN